MSTMIQPGTTRTLFFLALLTLLLTCGFGCGGGSHNASTASPFRGIYLGAFTLAQTGNTQTGSLTGTVANDGTFSGGATNPKDGVTGTVTGTFSPSGQTTVTFVYPDTTYTATGISAIGANGHLLGSLTATQGATTLGPLTFDLTPQ